jgi:hypothetical protein
MKIRCDQGRGVRRTPSLRHPHLNLPPSKGEEVGILLLVVLRKLNEDAVVAYAGALT